MDAQFAQLFLEALAVQADSAAAVRKTFQRSSSLRLDFEVALGLAEIGFRKQRLAARGAQAARLIAACMAAKTSARSS